MVDAGVQANPSVVDAGVSAQPSVVEFGISNTPIMNDTMNGEDTPEKYTSVMMRSMKLKIKRGQNKLLQRYLTFILFLQTYAFIQLMLTDVI
ncbi:unnamed protein product [Phytophthora lilii]|uniref:Unnamed protein product n=1 Tax=Phytophthora lilii TaxID=2077276 RepID=A0A9W6X788_9STRA|nr:unnamed protein product [Phytophthora lilii]